MRIFLREPTVFPEQAKIASIFLLACICFDRNLISFLKSPEHEHIPRTVEELALATSYRINFVESRGTAAPKYLKETSRPAITDMLPRLNGTNSRGGTEAIMRTGTEPKIVTLNYHKVTMIAAAANLTL